MVPFVRALILYAVLFLGVRLTGKKQLGDLEPVELILTVLLSEIAAVPLQDADAPLLSSIIAVVALLCLENILSVLSSESRFLDRILQGSPSLLVRDGKIDQKAMEKSDVTPDMLAEAFRQNGAVSLEEVRYCILETSGNMSVILKKDLPREEIPLEIMVKGHPVRDAMRERNITGEELDTYLRSKGIRRKDVYLLTATDGHFTLIPKETRKKS